MREFGVFLAISGAVIFAAGFQLTGLTLRRLLHDYCRSRLAPPFGSEDPTVHNERLGNCILIVGQAMAVGNTRL